MRQKGAVLLEFALVFPIFILLCLGGMDLLRLENAKADLDAIAVTTAGCFVHGDCNQPQEYARTLATDFLMKPENLSMTCSGNSCQVQYRWLPLSPFISASTLHSKATGVNP